MSCAVFLPFYINLVSLKSFLALVPRRQEILIGSIVQCLRIQGSEWDFGVFSGLEGVEKPNPKIYEIALERAGNIAPEEALHIGDSIRKDYEPAKSIGMHALLLDRFKTPDAENWRKSGAVVLPDLLAVQEWLSSEKSAC